MRKKREQLMETAIRLLAEEGVGVATARIAKEAEVSNGTLFNYFETKQNLIDSVYVYIKTKIADEVLSPLDREQPLHDLLLSVWLSFSTWCRKHPLDITALDLLKSSQLLSNEVKEKGNDAWAGIFSRVQSGIEDGTLVSVPSEIIFLSSEGMLNALMRYAHENQLSPSELKAAINQGFEIFWHGISTQYHIKE